MGSDHIISENSQLQLLVRFSQYVQLVRQDTLEKALGMDGKNLRDIGEQLLGKNPKSCWMGIEWE